jgi:hypothetical protein
MDFAELNRTRPDAAATQTVAWAMNAQVHASDDVSVMETLRGQAATVATARSFCPDCNFAVGPITLRPRFNPAATGPPLARDPDALPGHVDPRQATQLCAAWTAGSVAALALAGVGSLTYFELVGMAGVMAGERFPVYDVLQALTPLRGTELLECAITPDGNVAALATAEGIMLVNLSPSGQRLLIEGLPWPTVGEVLSAGQALIDLQPYAVMVLERGVVDA